MKIAILTPTFNYYSGIDRVVQSQAEEYVKKGNKVAVIALEAKIKSNKYKIIELGMPKNAFLQRLYRLFFFIDLKKLDYHKKLRDYDVVISHFYPMNWLAYIAKKHYNIKYIYFNHGVNTIGLLNNIWQGFYMKLFSFFTNITLKNVDEAYSVSKYLKDDLKKVSNLDSKVIYNKIDEKRFNKKVRSNKIINKYNLKNSKVLLYVGRIAPHKGIHLLLQSLNIIKKHIPNVKLLIVGKPTFKDYFRSLKKLDNKGVIFTGFVPDEDLPYYYAACDVYVTASLWEGFDLPATEAQACGKKVVAFDIGSHSEIVKNGTLVKNKDIKSFSEAVVKLIK
ncbi:MAG: glycosyltransferase family 4 protein [Flavobacteriales bacterium]|jgi:1,2-diacylglycerol 3-alpha-glucosyltransferase|nr:glycosyltransferase family 4 protein [Flavobacteriales bacterium]|tara:strand:+ start:202 stop:1206 length:1005 start_codon:yes stop_codon:yes gene_type:complete